ncbi:hypothetical protein BN844_2198 [Pseudomonas sp. SHC52]|nr:hypothetical protein BN844_2198 [Pseudomonas sp. SHC52]
MSSVSPASARCTWALNASFCLLVWRNIARPFAHQVETLI